MKLTEFYQTVGGDYADAMSRLQNDAFIVRFLRMLPRDGSMALLTEAVAASDVEKAFRAVHTLKGISLNLSLKTLAAACSDMTEALRGKTEFPAQAQSLYEAVSREYARVSAALEQLEA